MENKKKTGNEQKKCHKNKSQNKHEDKMKKIMADGPW
jgi:hypothetical protein